MQPPHAQKVSAHFSTALVARTGRSALGLTLIIAVGATLLWFSMLGTRALYEPDEGRYAEIAREMLQTGDFVTPHLNGLVYLEKPPLQYWLTAIAFRCFGESELTSRACTGIAGYLSLLVVFLVARRLWGPAAGVKAALLTAASTLFVLLGHQSTLDMLLSFWLLIALSSFLLAQAQREDRLRCRMWMLGCWAAMAFAVLTKGLIGVVVPAATLTLYLIWQRDRRALHELNARWGLLLFCVVAAPWFVWVSRANPVFPRFFFVREHLERYLTPIEHRTEPWWFYLPVLVLGILPWFPLALNSVIATLRQPASRGEWHPARLLCVFSTFVFVFFSFSNGKLVPYILPMIPALALLCASLPAKDDGLALRIGLALTLIESVILYMCGHLAWLFPKFEAFMYSGRAGLTWSAIALAAAAAPAFVLLHKNHVRAALTLLCIGAYVSTFGMLAAALDAQQFFSAKGVASDLQSAVPGAPVFSVQVYDQTLPFYLKHSVVLVDYRDEFELGLSQDPARGVANIETFEYQWERLDQGYAVMRRDTLDLLLASGISMQEIARTPDRVIVSRR